MADRNVDLRAIKPVEGRRMRHPGTHKVLSGPETVAWTSYWERALAAGDIALAEPPKPPAPPSPAPPAPPAVKV